jgi:phage-related holin
MQIIDSGYYLVALLRKILSYPIEKTLISIILSVFALLFDETTYQLLLGLLFLIIFDFFTGITAAKISGEIIASAKVFRSALKIVVYFILISAANLAGESVIVIDFIDDITLGFLAATEFISIMENAGRMGFCVPKKLLNTLKDYTSKQ